MKSIFCHRHLLSITSLVALYLVLVSSQAANAELMQSVRKGANLHLRFLYLLSDFSGPVPSQWARLAFDQQHQELFTLDLRSHEIRIFNKEGVEVFTFGGNGEISPLRDITTGDNGTIFGLPRKVQDNSIHVFNYRGELKETIPLNGVTEQFAYFRADSFKYQNGKFYLLDSKMMIIAIISSKGDIEQIIDIGTILRERENETESNNGENKPSSLDVSSFDIDALGNVYFTVPQLFSVYRLGIDGSLSSFGRSGSAPGKFGVVSGIAIDDRGNLYITDRLRSVVILFDSNFQFLGEFGYRGGLPEDLIVPDDIVVDKQGNRVFVSQAANKGVGVYMVIIE